MKGTSNRGFASMDAARQREIARKGGRAAHQKGTAHEFTSDEAREAGRRGGERVSANRQHMAEIGRRGGQKSSGRRRRQEQAAAQTPAAQQAAAPRRPQETPAQRMPHPSVVRHEVPMPPPAQPPSASPPP